MLLLQPMKVGSLKLQNRIVMPAMHLGYSPLGRITDQLLAFYRERALGGVGFIVVGGCVINAEAGGPMFLSLKSDDFVEPMSKLAAAIHEGGAKACTQLYHGGRYVHAMFLKGDKALAPSPIFSPFTKEMPREATSEDIERTVADFGKAALRAKEAGFDAVEILGSAGYIISQFLSPATNERTDGYGGSLENRMRFGLEVAEAVRAAVGPEMVVGIRLAGNEFVPGGGGSDLSQAFARQVCTKGVDYVSVTGGWHETRVPQILGEVPQGAFTYLSRKIRDAVDVPVFVANRLGDPARAERVLRQGLADAICMGRPLIADPSLPEKLSQGKPIVRCAACNQGCFDKITKLQPATCMVNPRAGKESKGALVPAAEPKKVVVVGGGPAGMMAALTAGRRGHQVVLFEKEQTLGGQLHIASAIPGKEPLATITKDLATALLDQPSVDIRLGTAADVDLVASQRPDVTFVATGAEPIALDLPQDQDAVTVAQAWDVLSGKAHVGKRAVVIGGGATGVETALHLARAGAMDDATAAFLLVHDAEPPELIRTMAARGPRQVSLIEMHRKVGQAIGSSTRWNVMAWLDKCGVDVRTSTTAEKVTAEGLVVRRKDKDPKTIKADTVVIALGARPVSALAHSLEDRGLKVMTIGDARQVRRALDATEEAFAQASAI